MKLDRSDVIQVTQEGKETAAQFVVPDLDLVVISTRYNQGVGQVKINATDGSVVLFKSINDSADAIIPAARLLMMVKTRVVRTNLHNKEHQRKTTSSSQSPIITYS